LWLICDDLRKPRVCLGDATVFAPGRNVMLLQAQRQKNEYARQVLAVDPSSELFLDVHSDFLELI
jgi:hypothetical protein